MTRLNRETEQMSNKIRYSKWLMMLVMILVASACRIIREEPIQHDPEEIYFSARVGWKSGRFSVTTRSMDNFYRQLPTGASIGDPAQFPLRLYPRNLMVELEGTAAGTDGRDATLFIGKTTEGAGMVTPSPVRRRVAAVDGDGTQTTDHSNETPIGWNGVQTEGATTGPSPVYISDLFMWTDNGYARYENAYTGAIYDNQGNEIKVEVEDATNGIFKITDTTGAVIRRVTYTGATYEENTTENPDQPGESTDNPNQPTDSTQVDHSNETPIGWNGVRTEGATFIPSPVYVSDLYMRTATGGFTRTNYTDAIYDDNGNEIKVVLKDNDKEIFEIIDQKTGKVLRQVNYFGQTYDNPVIPSEQDWTYDPTDSTFTRPETYPTGQYPKDMDKTDPDSVYDDPDGDLKKEFEDTYVNPFYDMPYDNHGDPINYNPHPNVPDETPIEIIPDNDGPEGFIDYHHYNGYEEKPPYKKSEIQAMDEIKVNWPWTANGAWKHEDIPSFAVHDYMFDSISSAELPSRIDGHHVELQMQHACAILRVWFAVDARYDQVRKVVLRNVQIKVEGAAPVDAFVQNESYPVDNWKAGFVVPVRSATPGDYTKHAVYSCCFFKPSHKATGTAYTDDYTAEFKRIAANTNLTMICTYDVYDKDLPVGNPVQLAGDQHEHLNREGVRAVNTFTLGQLGAIEANMTAGHYYDLFITINPEYLYVLGEHDNKHLTIE
ncbi:MAG: hypothetical protein MJZ89_06070 [Paludibacteraceae bacterium]|nr:hypothetical protein [Paludibacteraceae bacterium]